MVNGEWVKAGIEAAMEAGIQAGIKAGGLGVWDQGQWLTWQNGLPKRLKVYTM
jgi:hypothetical protein